MKRILARGSLMLVAAALATSGMATLTGPAGAAAPRQPGACKAVTTKTAGSNVKATVSKCTPLSATGGSGSGVFKAGQTSGKLAASLTWAKRKGTTKAT